MNRLLPQPTLIIDFMVEIDYIKLMLQMLLLKGLYAFLALNKSIFSKEESPAIYNEQIMWYRLACDEEKSASVVDYHSIRNVE